MAAILLDLIYKTASKKQGKKISLKNIILSSSINLDLRWLIMIDHRIRNTIRSIGKISAITGLKFAVKKTAIYQAYALRIFFLTIVHFTLTARIIRIANYFITLIYS